MPRNNISLFSRTGIIVAITLFFFQAAIITSLVIFLLMPVIKSSAVTMATIMEMSAKTWTMQTAEENKIFNKELKKRYNFELFVDKNPAVNINSRPHEPYLFYLEDELANDIENPPLFYGGVKDPDIYWIDYNANGHHFNIAVPLHQPGGKPHSAIIAIVISGFTLLFISSWFLAYHLNKPIDHLINAIKQVSHGIYPKIIPETGCNEMMILAQNVNIMAKKVNDLLENRTVMLAGISHDLRTPLTRMALSVEMLPKDNKLLTQRISQDICLMNEMITHYMELARCLSKEKPEQLDLHAIINSYIQEIKQHTRVDIKLIMPDINSKSMQELWIYPVALKRIINNLLENAIRYGGSKPVIISCEKIIRKNNNYIVIKIIDHGPGIPEAEIEKVFQPFYRLEKSRNSNSGGSGLGLAIVYQLSKAHDWLIELESPENCGLTAKLTLPVR